MSLQWTADKGFGWSPDRVTSGCVRAPCICIMLSLFSGSLRYLLQPKGNGSKSKSDDLGSLRLKLTYIEDTVLPSACYTPLCNLLLKSPDVKVKQQLSSSSYCMSTFKSIAHKRTPLFACSRSRRQQHTSWATSAESDTRPCCRWFDCCSTTIALCLLSLQWRHSSWTTLSKYM